MKDTDLQRDLDMAIPLVAAKGIWSERLGYLVKKEFSIGLAIFAIEPSRIIKWIEPNDTEPY